MSIQSIVVRIAISVVLASSGSAASAADHLTSSQRAEQALTLSPNRDAIYIDIPAAGSPVANWMLGAVAGKAAWMDRLKAVMALGAETPSNLIVGGESAEVTHKAVQSAIQSFAGTRLPHLTRTLVGPPAKAEKLRTAAESSGITYVVQPADGQ